MRQLDKDVHAAILILNTGSSNHVVRPSFVCFLVCKLNHNRQLKSYQWFCRWMPLLSRLMDEPQLQNVAMPTDKEVAAAIARLGRSNTMPGRQVVRQTSSYQLHGNVHA